MLTVLAMWPGLIAAAPAEPPAGEWVPVGFGIQVEKGVEAKAWTPPDGASKVGESPLSSFRGFIRVRVPWAGRVSSTDGTVIIGMDDGASADPAFALWPGDRPPRERPPAALQIEGATELFVRREGTLYARGDGNRFHVERRKLVVEDRRLTEVRQPYLYVGARSVVREPLELRAEPKGASSLVARVEAGQEVEVLLAQPRSGDARPDAPGAVWFLARTAFGLVGWASCDVTRGCRQTLGLFFHGD